MVWAPPGLKKKPMPTYTLIYAWDVTGRKHKKMGTVVVFGKGNWETGRKGWKRDLSCTVYFL